MDNYTFQLVDKQFIIAESFLKTPFCEGTFFYKTFFDSQFAPQKEIPLMYSESTFKLIIPLMREGILYIPKKKNFPELYSLLNYLAGNNDYWVKLASLIKNPRIMNPIGKIINLSEEVFEGHYFTKETAPMYEPYSKELDDKIQACILEEAKSKDVCVSLCRSYNYDTSTPDYYHTHLAELGRQPMSHGVYKSLMPMVSFSYDVNVSEYKTGWCENISKDLEYHERYDEVNNMHYRIINGVEFVHRKMADYQYLKNILFQSLIDPNNTLDNIHSTAVTKLIDCMVKENKKYYVLWL